MAETTGTRGPTTGPQRTITIAAGQVVEGAVQAAYRAYVEHRPGCQACQAGDTLQCPAAEALWEAYKEARA